MGNYLKLYALISGDIATPGNDYERITNRELELNTKGYFPRKFESSAAIKNQSYHSEMRGGPVICHSHR